MKYIDRSNWARRQHFEFFTSLDYPPFNLTAMVDIAPLSRFAKARNWSIFRTVLYLTSRAANEIPEFRQRIRGEDIVEHEVVHPSYTSMTDANVFSFTEVDYQPDIEQFFAECLAAESAVKSEASLEDDPNRDDYLFLSCVPWVHFTSFVHPVHISGVDSVPRITWGKHVWKGDRLEMPLSMQAHHALVDGWHTGQFFKLMEEMAQTPEAFL
ncbi:chloramphenicol acetyltransferase [Pontibacter sp. G13]|uniref:chloramphenicol acetyltransferase n=1 Tax=Pontibacter sp. G13 TaxID=3074898 RepID=UPI00288B08C7|nr:chloramphenicol acetyltransferase [Pontibacter sp. G13]WNJ18482.1 chloramphenicol acetyltransferase [Pontibacter sp. G13]